MTAPGDSTAIPRLRVSLPLSHPACTRLSTGLLRLTRVLVSSPRPPTPPTLWGAVTEAVPYIGDQITMFQDFTHGSNEPTIQPIIPPEPQYEFVNHMLFGSPAVVRHTIALLHKLNYAEPNDWSKPSPTGRPNEVMAILTKRVRVA